MADAATYTHGHHESVLRSHRTRTVADSAAYLAPRLGPGRTLLDVGCGPATITVGLAGLVGRVTAIEVTAEAVAIARAEVAARGVPNVVVEQADVSALPFADGSFDVVHAHQVLQHLADPVGALREMRRVCRPGGVVAVRDADYGAFTWYPELPALDRWRALYVAAARANGGEPDAGRRLLAWAHAAGLADVTASASTWCYADPAARAAWAGAWAERITGSALARQLLAEGRADAAELAAIATAWRTWAADPDGVITLVHHEILATP